jgi:hypothetical protein
MRAVRVACVLVLLVLLHRAVSAQPATGSIAGSVSASNGIGLPGAIVSIHSDEAGIDRTVTTNDDGEYVIDNLPAGGGYSLHAELIGFTSATREGVAVAQGARATVSFLLVPTTAETLSVTGRLTPILQQRGTVQATISDQLTHSLPLIGRDFISLVSLTPGFTGNPNAPSPNGQIYWSNNVLVDGASHYSKWRSAARTFYSGYSLEAIREVQVLNSQFSAEFGEALASVTTATTKSGTNERHGSALFFGQAGPLNDQPVFATRKVPASSARFGFTIGGPATEDRTFYFASYEGRRARSNNFSVSPAAQNVAVPNNEDEHLAFVKLDHRLRTNDLFTVRYNGQFFRWHNEFGGLFLPGTGTQYRNDVHTLLFTATQLVSTHVLNQVRVQFARYTDVRTDLNRSVYVLRAGYSIEGAALGPYGFGANPEDTYEAADTLTHYAGNHAVKMGGGFKSVRAHNESLPFGGGAYYFAGPPSLYPQPYAYTQGVAASPEAVSVDPRSVSGFGFIQDDWRVNGQFAASLGLRYDIEQIRNVDGYRASVDGNNLQPRASVTWSPFGGQFAVRGGAGLYTQQHLLYYVNRAQLEGPNGTAMVTLTPASALMPTYPNTVPATVLSQFPRDEYVVDPHFRNPYSVQAAGGVHMRLLGFGVDADYVYLAGKDLMSIVDANAPASVPKPAQRSVAEADLTRPSVPAAGGFRKVISLGNEGRSWYRGLQVKAQRSNRTLDVLATYTLARARDMANYQLPEDSRNLAAEEARSDNDVRHNVTTGLTWQLPFQRGASSGWSLAATGQFRTNRPFNITWGDDRNGTTQNDARPGRRNTGQTGLYRNIDLALSRKLPVLGQTLELRLEAFNALSTTNYDEYAGAVNSPLYSQPVSAFPKRRLQFAAVYRF